MTTESVQAGEQESMTIEQLSAKTNVTTRNIRAFQSRNLVPPPETRGRIGYYNEGHRARLQLITSMQKRGFSLAAIRELLSAWEQGRGLREVIGFETELTASWSDEAHLYTADELRDMFEDDSAPHTEFLEGAAALGLLEKHGKRYAVDHPEAMRMGVEALRAGIPTDVVLEEADRAMKAARQIAERLVSVYIDHVWEPFVEAGMPASQLTNVTKRLRRLRLFAGGMMSGMLLDALGQVIEEAAATELEKSTSANRARYMTGGGRR